MPATYRTAAFSLVVSLALLQGCGGGSGDDPTPASDDAGQSATGGAGSQGGTGGEGDTGSQGLTGGMEDGGDTGSQGPTGGMGDGGETGSQDLTGGTGNGGETGSQGQAGGTGGGGETGANPGDGDVSEIAGLYDASYQENGLTDVIYVGVTADGAWTEYDYDGDEYDQGENCYFITGGRVRRLEGNTYLVSYTGEDAPGEGDVGMLTRTADGLFIEYVDRFDEDGDGDTEETLTELWPHLVGISAVDFNGC